MNQANILDTSKFHLDGDFDSQVEQLLSFVRLTRTEVENLQRLICDVERTLGEPWPGCQVYPFGSVVTGLGIRTSDIDCYVSLPSWVKIHSKLVYKAKAFLDGRPNLFSELFAIPMAKVPIVKFYHKPTSCHCDINFSSLAGVENSKLLAYLLHVDSRALQLAVLVKYWSKVHNLTGTNLMPNFALTLLVIFYLQHLDILPSVHLLQQSVEKRIIDDWNTAFDRIDYKISTENTLSLYQLLGGFFDFYSSFDFANEVVSTYLGRTLPKDCFKDIKTVPEQFELYRHNLTNKVCRQLRVDTKMCVQDPFEHSRNCSVAIHQKLFDKVLHYIKTASKAFHDEQNETFLKAILTKVQYKEEVEVKNKNQQRRKFVPKRVLMKRNDKLKNHIRQNITKNVQVWAYQPMFFYRR